MATSRLVSRARPVWPGLLGVAFVFMSSHCAPTGSFYKGVAEGEVDPAFGPLEALRLSIQTDSPVWVILSEVRLAGIGLTSYIIRSPKSPAHPEPDSFRSF